MQFPRHPQGTVAGTVVHKDELEGRAVAGPHFIGHPAGFPVKQRHGLLFIITGNDKADEHRHSHLSDKFYT